MMAELVSIKDYYNKLVQVQTSIMIVEALDAELHHHMNNTAAVFEGAMRVYGIQDKERGDAFKKVWREVAEELTIMSNDLMQDVRTDANDLAVENTHLEDLVAHPEQMTPKNFMLLAAFNDRLRSVDEKLREIRIDSEIRLLRSSGLVGGDFSLEEQSEAFKAHYTKLTQVQMSGKVARAFEKEIEKRFGATGESARIMKPVSEGVLNLNVTSTRLLDLVTHSGMLTDETFIRLSALNDTLNTANENFRKLQARLEISRMKQKGVVPAGFTI